MKKSTAIILQMLAAVLWICAALPQFFSPGAFGLDENVITLILGAAGILAQAARLIGDVLDDGKVNNSFGSKPARCRT